MRGVERDGDEKEKKEKEEVEKRLIQTKSCGKGEWENGTWNNYFLFKIEMFSAFYPFHLSDETSKRSPGRQNQEND